MNTTHKNQKNLCASAQPTDLDNTQGTGEPTREQLLTSALLDAQNRKWDGWNWKEYQKAIVRQNWHISELERMKDAFDAAMRSRDRIIDDWNPPNRKAESAELERVKAERDELLEALKRCETDEGALGYLYPEKHARKRFDAINGAIFAVIDGMRRS